MSLAMSLLSLSLGVFFSWNAFSAPVLHISTILDKLTGQGGKGFYQLEQEVQLSNDKGAGVTLRESWTIENDSSMKLVVSGPKDKKDLLHLVYLYQNAQRLSQTGKSQKIENSKMAEDFYQSLFFFRKSDRLGAWLQKNGILQDSQWARKSTARTLKDFNSQKQDAGLRLGRTSGVIAMVLGPNPVQDQTLPALWVEQDLFQVRKLRFPSGTEISFDKHAPVSSQLLYPRTTEVRWSEGRVASIQVLSIQSRGDKVAKLKLGGPADASSGLDGITDEATRALVNDFYSRLR